MFVIDERSTDLTPPLLVNERNVDAKEPEACSDALPRADVLLKSAVARRKSDPMREIELLRPMMMKI